MTAPMNSQNFPDHDLSRHLARKADQFDHLGGSPLELGQVLDRAGEIKRGRRMRATMAMTAAVLAIAVPTAVIALDNDATREIQPAPPVQKVDGSPLTLDGLKKGAPPSTGYATAEGIWHDGSESTPLVGSGQELRAVAAIDQGFLVAVDTGEGMLQTRFVRSDGTEDDTTWPSSDAGVAVSADGKLGAFVQADGTPVVVQDGARGTHELPRIPGGSALRIVGVGGPDCTLQAEYAGCAVWVTSRAEKPQTWQADSSGEVASIWPELGAVATVADGSWVAGITELKDDLSTCAAVGRFAEGTPVWTTCGHVPVAFSPGSDRLLTEPDHDGAGSQGLTVYDSDSGDVVLDLRTAEQSVLPSVIWEDDAHVLATILQGTRAAVLRIGLDGSREYAVPPTDASDDFVSPFVLPSR